MAEYIHVPSGTKVNFDGVLNGPMYKPVEKPKPASKTAEKPKKSKKADDGATG